MLCKNEKKACVTVVYMVYLRNAALFHGLAYTSITCSNETENTHAGRVTTLFCLYCINWIVQLGACKVHIRK